METKSDSVNTEHAFCSKVELTPAQCNDVIEDKLAHLLPVMQGALFTFRSVNHRLANGEISWRKLFNRAKESVLNL